jgi:cytochrome b subunit of formate dehydrogenase
MQSFHGLALRMGSLTAANCSSCHGIHDVLPSRDPQSPVNKLNLPRTCGKCHPNIGTRLAETDFRIHAPPGAADGKPWIVNFIARAYIALIILIIGGMFLHNALDFAHKLRIRSRAVRDNTTPARLTPWMRAQHLVLMALFITLAYTGFVHRFPDAVWSLPFRCLPNGNDLRALIHHIAGWSFIALFAAHLVLLIGTRAGRGHCHDLWPRRHDFNDALAMLAHNLGRAAAPPPHRRWNYMDKIEYWALIWGSLIMIITGLMLLFMEPVLRSLPKVCFDLAQIIHYYEAVLAVLAIVIWHFYWVKFHPHKYPTPPASSQPSQ